MQLGPQQQRDTLWSLGCTTLRFLPHGPKGLILLIVGVPYSLDFG